jgi:hypothetical protein
MHDRCSSVVSWSTSGISQAYCRKDRDFTATISPALVGEEGVEWPWMMQLTAELQQQGMLDSAAAQALEGDIPTAEANAVSV